MLVADSYCHGWRCLGQRFTRRNLPPLTGAVHSMLHQPQGHQHTPHTSPPPPPPHTPPHPPMPGVLTRGRSAGAGGFCHGWRCPGQSRRDTFTPSNEPPTASCCQIGDTGGTPDAKVPHLLLPFVVDVGQPCMLSIMHADSFVFDRGVSMAGPSTSTQ